VSGRAQAQGTSRSPWLGRLPGGGILPPPACPTIGGRRHGTAVRTAGQLLERRTRDGCRDERRRGGDRDNRHAAGRDAVVLHHHVVGPDDRAPGCGGHDQRRAGGHHGGPTHALQTASLVWEDRSASAPVLARGDVATAVAPVVRSRRHGVRGEKRVKESTMSLCSKPSANVTVTYGTRALHVFHALETAPRCA